MTYVVLDSTANLAESFDDETEARAALQAIVHLDPASAGEYALLSYDENGRPVGEAVLGIRPDPHAGIRSPRVRRPRSGT
jgi:hypothetical protein